MKKNALIVGGSNGIGLAITNQLLHNDYEKVYILDRCEPDIKGNNKIKYIKINLLNDDFSRLYSINDINTLIITAGFGRIAPFSDLTEAEIINSFKVNDIAAIRIIKRYYDKIAGKDDFYCAVMGSIAGFVSSPLFSIYGATKAALCKFIESVNIELEKGESANRILNVSPGSIKGTKFNDGENDLTLTTDLAKEILSRMFARETLFIPEYKNVYKSVLERYNNDAHLFGLQSYEYKLRSGRANTEPQVKIGYLSGTFDLFHIGHLNILKRAKDVCDYLVVGVHKDGSHKKKETYIPFEERVEIVKSIKYVDKVIESYPEDHAVYEVIKYHYLFVGSDYKGTERFRRYEEYFKDKNVEIIYFPYTTGTSSTQLRAVIDKNLEVPPQK